MEPSNIRTEEIATLAEWPLSKYIAKRHSTESSWNKDFFKETNSLKSEYKKYQNYNNFYSGSPHL